MALEDVCVHTARPVQSEASGPKVDGRPQVSVVEGTPFECCLFLPAPGGEDERQGRRVRRPTLLMLPEDTAGERLEVKAKQRLRITALEVTGPAAVEWQVEGDPQPFGKPGDDLIGWQATLRRVED